MRETKPLLLTLERQSELIGAIYDCALDPGRWQGALMDVGTVCNFKTLSFAVIDLKQYKFLLNITANIPEPWLSRMASFVTDVPDIWGGQENIMRLDMNEPHVATRVTSREHVHSTRYVREWGLPQGLIDVLAIGVARDESMIGNVGFGRHESAGPVTDEDIATARLFVPHLQRAVAISRIFDIKSVAEARFEGALNALTAGVFIVDEKLRIVHLNEAARNLSGLVHPPRAPGSVLALRAGPAAKALQQAVTLATNNEAGLGRRGLGVPLGPGEGGPAVLHVLPLKHGQLRANLVPGGVAAVFVARPTAPMPAPAEAMASIYDLTAGEARVLAVIADGATTAQTAEKLGVGLGTVKSHLHQIFAKTGTSRQAELVLLAASLAPPV